MESHGGNLKDKTSEMVGDNNSKLFSQRHMNFLENNLYNATFNNISVGILYDKIINIISNNKHKFSVDFEVGVWNNSIIVYANCGLMLEVIELNIFDDLVELSSIIYDLNNLKEEFESCDEKRYVPNDELNELKKQLKKEKKKLKKMFKDEKNFIPVFEEQLTWDMFEPQMVGIKPIDKQKKIIENIESELNRKFGYFTTQDEYQQKLSSLIDILEEMNLEDFDTLIKIFEDNLNFEIEKKDCISIIKNQKSLILSEIFKDLSNNKIYKKVFK